jgi:ABC-type polysaccharide/polyol phosphate export permease
MGWSLLHPIAMTTILCSVFYKLWPNQNIREYGPYLMAGLVTWNYILTSALNGCQCFFQGESYIRQYPAPLAVYPLRTALGGTVHFLMAMIVVLGLTWLFKGFHDPVCLFSLIPSILLLFVFAWSLATIAGFANVHFQDTQHLTEVGFQILFYATPIIYGVSMLEGTGMGWLLKFNPLLPLFQLIREPILDGHGPGLNTVAFALCTVTVMFLAACVTLQRLQKRLIFHL